MSDRQSVPDVPVIYFVEPTAENIHRIVTDYRAGLYSYMHVNFSCAIPTKLLQSFAESVSKLSSSRSEIVKVVDRYCSFVSLSANVYSLNMKSTYLYLNKVLNDSLIETKLGEIASGVVSMLMTSGCGVPIIRAPPPDSSAAGLVAKLVSDQMTGLFNSGSVSAMSTMHSGPVDPLHAQRPLLVILDREIDLSPMVAHAWSYQSLIEDILGMNLNKVATEGGWDINTKDQFWKIIAHLPFPEAATAINEKVNEFSKMRTNCFDSDGGSSLMNAMSSMPQITELKKTVDMHTSIATILLNRIKESQFDKFVEFESSSGSNLRQILADEKISEIHKIRVLIYSMLKFGPSVSAGLDSKWLDHQAVKHVRNLQSLKQQLIGSSTPPPVQRSSLFENIAEKVKTRGEEFVKNVKTLMNDKCIVRSIVQQLADQQTATESFAYYDPQHAGSVVRVRGSFRQVLVCMVGGGST